MQSKQKKSVSTLKVRRLSAIYGSRYDPENAIYLLEVGWKG
jgi:hypothetical protein